MQIKTFKGGVHPEENKDISKSLPVERYLPKGDLVFPVNQHIGAPAKPVVKKGDQVLAGQLIAEAGGFVSANIVSSCSGTVKAVEERVVASGAKATCIVIENDGQFTPAPGIGVKRTIEELSDKDILAAIRSAGIVGMGGAGFPADVKLMPKNASEIDYVIANGCECEPYITCDDRLMQDKNLGIIEGLKLVLQLFPNAQGVIAIEDNKPDAIKDMEGVCAGENRMYVQPVMTKYPQGGERSLISVIAGRDLKVGMLPAQLGCVVCNVATLYAIYLACLHSEPLMERYFTITGDAVKEPKTVIAKIGTSTAELIEAAGGIKDGVKLTKVLSGGPMMGLALSSLDVPIAKNNNALTVLAEDPVEAAEQKMTACIRCGRCSRVCPIRLIPQQMAVACENHDLDQFQKLYGMDCFQCGSCTFICPAKRPLMQLFKDAKAAVTAKQRAEAAARAAAAAKEGGK
ncbi:MAG: electron transport complex subunit RsxC [Lachnospiraceae bacterium]|nr:electron transport complex subunit RsxC [Lachnospiraceae bacterium]